MRESDKPRTLPCDRRTAREPPAVAESPEEESMVLRPFRLFATFGVALLATGIAFSQTDVVTNGSFESGLANWIAAPSTSGNGLNTTCGFNASTAAGTETLSGTASLPPSAGTQLAMGSGQEPGATPSSCVLYRSEERRVGKECRSR